jgi:2-desacetyl-2-hydroxyethyl bacteriochlorophyllide A dehydrogenase
MARNIILDGPGQFQYGETILDENLQPGETLVRVRSIGICGTDYHAFHGRQPFFNYPRIIGHELGVEVIKTADNVSEVKVGDHCAVEPYLYCGKCNACKIGKTNCCENLRVLGVHIDGGMQEMIKIAARQLHPSAKLNDSQLALVETLGIGFHAVQRAQVVASDTVLVIGAGPIGLSVMEFLRQAETVVVMDRDEQRLNFCLQWNYAKKAIKSEGEVVMQIRNAFNGQLPSIVFDATGDADSMNRSFSFTSNGGKLVFVGLFPGEVHFSDPEFHRKELTLMASRNSRSDDFNAIIKRIEDGTTDTDKWITHRLEFESFIPSFNQLVKNTGGLIKAMVTIKH